MANKKKWKRTYEDKDKAVSLSFIFFFFCYPYETLLTNNPGWT